MFFEDSTQLKSVVMASFRTQGNDKDRMWKIAKPPCGNGAVASRERERRFERLLFASHFKYNESLCHRSMAHLAC